MSGHLYTAVHDYHSDTSGDLVFSAGDTIVLEDTSDEPWWLGSVQGKEGVSGLFPMNYVEAMGDTGGATGAAGDIVMATALHAYQSDEPGDLTFEEGDVIQVTGQDPGGWWEGTIDGRE